jgi:DNA-directed RNA polymerase specialized sigma24 family protein
LRVKDERVSDADEDPVSEFETLYREHGDRLWRALYAFTGSAELADDAVAEAFTQAMRGATTIREPIRWIWRVAFRVASGELKERGRSGPWLDSTVLADPVDPSGAVDLLLALGRLSPNQRAAIVLHHYAGYGTREIAEMIGSTPGAVRVHLSIGRRRLRRLITEEGLD